jgi:hypothetical protein
MAALFISSTHFNGWIESLESKSRAEQSRANEKIHIIDENVKGYENDEDEDDDMIKPTFAWPHLLLQIR